MKQFSYFVHFVMIAQLQTLANLKHHRRHDVIPPWWNKSRTRSLLYIVVWFRFNSSGTETGDSVNGPLARYVKLRVAHAPGMPGTFSLPLRVSDPDMQHGTCVMHVPWCMSGSLTSGFLGRRGGKTFPQLYVLVRGPCTATDGRASWVTWSWTAMVLNICHGCYRYVWEWISTFQRRVRVSKCKYILYCLKFSI